MQSRSKREVPEMVPTEHESEEVDWQLTDTSMSAERVKKVAAAAILASLSIAVSPVASMVPRVPLFGIALFDPISLFWVIAFLVGGIWVGSVSMVAGVIMLNFFDPYPIIGPLLKFLATAPMIVLPWLAVRGANGIGKDGILSRIPLLGKGIEEGAEGGSMLSGRYLYGALMFLAYLVRLAVMIPVNLTVVPILWGVSDFVFIVGYTLVLNTIQSFWDAFLPFIVIHRTPVFKNYGMW
jgi:hypothetical protein